jgi:hypothetical protein
VISALDQKGMHCVGHTHLMLNCVSGFSFFFAPADVASADWQSASWKFR